MKKNIYLLFLLLPFSTNSQINLDSLWSVWNDPGQPDTNRLKAIDRIIWNNYLFTQPDSAFYFAQLEYDLAKEKKNKKFIADALNTQGVSFSIRGDYDKAIDYYSQSLKIREELGDKQSIARSLNNIGSICFQQGDYAKAMNYYSKSLKIREELGDMQGIASTLNNIGLIYFEQDDCANAIDCYNKSLKTSEGIGDSQGIANTLNNIGSIYYYQGDYTNALDYWTQSLNLQKELGNKTGVASSLDNIGNIYASQGDSACTSGNKTLAEDKYAKALDYHTQSLKIKEEIGNKQGIATSLNNIGGIYKELGNSAYHSGNTTLSAKKYTIALEYCQEALILATEIGAAIEIQDASQSLWLINKALGRNKESLEMYELYISTRDSLQSEENQRAVIQQEYQYNYEKQHISDSLAFEQQQELEKVAHQAELEKEAQQRYVLYGGLGFLLLLGGVAFRGYTRKKKDNQLISVQKKEVEEAHQKLESTHEQLEESHQEIKDSINYAERIQRSFLANKALLDENLNDYYVFFQPKDVVSGDFYWASTLQNGSFALCCADSTGHGVPGAIMSLLNITSLEKAIENHTEPHHVLGATRKIIIERLKQDGSADGGKDGMDCSFLVFNPEKTKLSFAVAHNPVFIVRKGELIEFKGDKMPVGKHDKQNEPFTLHEFDLQKGDLIYTLTDGFPDQFGGAKGKKYMIKNLKTKFLEIAQLPLSEQKELLSAEFGKWKGDHDQIDDVCVIGVKV